MRRLFVLLVLVACAGSPPAPQQATGPVHVQLLALNDFHGNLEPPSGTVRLADGTVPAGGGLKVHDMAFLRLYFEVTADFPLAGSGVSFFSSQAVNAGLGIWLRL